MDTEEQEIIDGLRREYKRMESAGQEWTEATLAYAGYLRKGRQRAPGDREFGLWLVDHDLDAIGKNDRAALLKIAEYPDLFRDVMAGGCRRSSWQHTWLEEMAPRLPHVRKGDDPTPESANLPVAPQEIAESVEPEGNESVATTHTPPAPSDHQLARTPLRHLPHVELVLSHILNKDTRTLLVKCQQRPRYGRAVWDLLVESIQAQAYGEPSRASVTKPNLRLVLPWAPIGYAARFNLMEPESRAKVRQDIFPVVQTHRDELRREPGRLPTLVGAFMRAQLEADQVRRAAARHVDATKALPTEETEIVVCGRALWPTQFTPSPWSYHDALEAAWFFRAIRGFLPKLGTPHEGAVALNILLKWLPIRDSGLARAVRDIGLAYEANPDGTILAPPPPVNFGM